MAPGIRGPRRGGDGGVAARARGASGWASSLSRRGVRRIVLRPARSAAAPIAPAAPACQRVHGRHEPASCRRRVQRSVSRTTAARTARASISVTLTGLGDDALSTGAFDIAGTGRRRSRERRCRPRAQHPALRPPRRRRRGRATRRRRRRLHEAAGRRPAPGRPARDRVRWLRLDPHQIAGAEPWPRSRRRRSIPAGALAVPRRGVPDRSGRSARNRCAVWQRRTTPATIDLVRGRDRGRAPGSASRDACRPRSARNGRGTPSARGRRVARRSRAGRGASSCRCPWRPSPPRTATPRSDPTP